MIEQDIVYRWKFWCDECAATEVAIDTVRRYPQGWREIQEKVPPILADGRKHSYLYRLLCVNCARAEIQQRD